MALRKKEKSGGGAPEWLVTYGDMVTLLLTFFVLLLSMSEIRKDVQMAQFMQAMREAFGYVQRVQAFSLEQVTIPSDIDSARVLIVPVRPENVASTQDEGLRGKRTRVDTIRPGQYYQAGGKIQFAELSAELTETERQRVREFAAQIRGFSTQIQVRGHCSKRPVEGTAFADHFDLSGQRARVVAQELVAAGIDVRRLLVVAAGTSQPIATDAYDSTERERNDVVELLQVDQTFEEFQP